MRRFEGVKLASISLITFVAWIIAAQDWVRLLAVVWLIYPVIVTLRVLGRRNAH